MTTQKTQYEIDGMMKFSEVDIYEEGCQPNTGGTFFINEFKFKADTVKELIKKVCEQLGIENKEENYLLNSCEEAGRIDFQLMENSEGFIPTASQIELWKKGKIKLWACTYTAHVEKVTRETIELKLE
jgi:hypothetical protein